MPKPLSQKTLEKKYAELGLPQEQTEFLHTFFRCCANLYGTLSLREAWEVFRHYEGTRVHKKEFVAFSGIVQRQAGLPYSVYELKEIYTGETTTDPLERLIVNNKLVTYGYYKFVRVFATLEEQENKPWYLPDRETFLSFAEDRFYLTPEGSRMRKFIEGLKTTGFTAPIDYGAWRTELFDPDGVPVKGKKLSEAVFLTPFEQGDLKYYKSETLKQRLREKYTVSASKKILDQIELNLLAGDPIRAFSRSEDLTYLIGKLETEYGVSLTEKQILQLTDLFVTLNNTSNQWANRGWTPDGLSQRYSRNSSNPMVLMNPEAFKFKN